MKINIDNVKKPRSFLLCVLLFIATLFMGIAYAAVNSVTAEVLGDAVAVAYEGVFISKVEYSDGVNVDLDNTQINSYSETMLSTTVAFLDNSVSSYAVYDITIKNNTSDKYVFSEALFDELFYTDSNGNFNSSILFELIGIEEGDLLESKSSISFQIKFYYSTNVSQNVLNSYINFSFDKAFSVTYASLYKGDYPSFVIAGENLVIDMSIDSFDYLAVQLNGNDIDNYTYENYILTVPNVSGDIRIEGSYGTPVSYFVFDEATGTIVDFTDSSYDKAVVIPDSINGVKVTAIGDNAFSYCTEITSVVIPEGVTTIGESAFRDCYSVTDYVIPNTVIEIADNAFREGRSLVSIVVPDSVITIGTWVFAGCSNLETVYLGVSVNSIGDSTFSYDPKLQTVYIAAGNDIVIPSNRWGASSSVTFVQQ